ncbi:MAG: ankyrin repeat domain-containing protein [Proteobacteria bacterium]|nr:ankyrin repeat domain-containing protein [Pseudomonadota bacterium]
MNDSVSDKINTILNYCRKGKLPELQKGIGEGLTHKEITLYELQDRNFSPLSTALKHGQWKMARYLIQENIVFEPADKHSIIVATQCKKDDIQGLELVFSHTGNADIKDENHRTALMTACLLGHINKAKYLVPISEDLDTKDKTGMNAFLDSIISQSIPIFGLLIKHQVDVHAQNNFGENAMLLAVQSKKPNTKLIKLLIDQNINPETINNNGISAIQIASNKYPSIYKLMSSQIHQQQQMELPLFSLKNDGNKNQMTDNKPLKLDPKQVSSEIHNEPPSLSPINHASGLPHSNDWFSAVMNGNLGIINKMIIQGFDVNTVDEKACTALIHAAGCGNRAVASFLMKNHAKIEHKSNNGSTALSSAIISNSSAIIELMLERGANPRGTGPGAYSYVTLAAAQWSEASLGLLADHGARLEITDVNHSSLYHTIVIAAEYYSNILKAKSTVRFLKFKGLNINIKDSLGNTALHVLCGALKTKIML